MNCPNCHSFVQPNYVHCKQCGAQLPTAPAEPPELDDNELASRSRERQDADFDFGAIPDESPWQFSSEEGWVPTPRATGELSARTVEEVQWGGFWRRGAAFIVDALIVGGLAAIMTVMAYVGYKVGLAAHGRSPGLNNSIPLVLGLTWAAMLLAIGYFVMLHTMTGKTVGKTLFKLRVVDANQEGIGFGRALLRFIAVVVTAPLILGLLWMLWSREKRTWHDYLAGTWVMRA